MPASQPVRHLDFSHRKKSEWYRQTTAKEGSALFSSMLTFISLRKGSRRCNPIHFIDVYTSCTDTRLTHFRNYERNNIFLRIDTIFKWIGTWVKEKTTTTTKNNFLIENLKKKMRLWRSTTSRCWSSFYGIITRNNFLDEI